MAPSAHLPRSFPLWKRLLFTLVALILALVAAEILLRLSLPSRYWILFDSASDWRLDSRLGWDQKGNWKVEGMLDGRLIQFQTNPDGLLPDSARPEAAEGQPRIMIFGDSTVVGRAVAADERIHAQLERQLLSRGIRAKVINAGVQGYSTDQVLLKMEELVPRYSPRVILYGFCSNDLGGISQELVYGWPKPRFLKGSAGLVLKPPPSIRPPSSELSIRALVQRVAIYRLLQPYLLVFRAQLGGWEDRNIIGLENFDYYYDRISLDRADWELFQALVSRMKAVAVAQGARFYIYAHPALEEVWDPSIRQFLAEAGVVESSYDRYALERRLQQVAAAVGISLVPLIDPFLAHSAEGPFHLLPRDPHCNAKGYQLTAEILASALSINPAPAS